MVNFSTIDENKYVLQNGKVLASSDEAAVAAEKNRKIIEPWLTALFQSEHLSLLLGNGFTTGISNLAGITSASMNTTINFKDIDDDTKIEKAIDIQAKKMGRGKPNCEDYIRVIDQLICGYEILDEKDKKELLIKKRNEIVSNLLQEILVSEIHFNEFVPKEGSKDPVNYLVFFLLSFASRTATRERLNIFTTNYDRFIEYGADIAGLHVLDRFVGTLEPIFRNSKLDLDLHYNPPGIRGEPRYLEGVVRLTKLHGSLDWIYKNGFVRKTRLPFGWNSSDKLNAETVMIYPTAAKDKETSDYPYVDLFRDYAATVCRPNSVLVTYGYGFGDSHINRVIADMLTIPSTHLVVLSYSDDENKIERFCNSCRRPDQLTVLIGKDFASIENLVDFYLPKSAIDKITIREADVLRNRRTENEEENANIITPRILDELIEEFK